MAGQETEVHRQVIPMIFPMIQRAKNDRSVREHYLFTTMSIKALQALRYPATVLSFIVAQVLA